MNQTIKAIAAGLALYAVYLPLAFVIGRQYTLPDTPKGDVIEKILKIDFDHPDHYYGRLYTFNRTRIPDPSILAVYEDTTLLSDFNITADGESYLVRFSTSDGSDARTNGRSYWVVPK